MLYSVIVDTGCRLREAYTLRREYIDAEKHSLRVDGTKKRGGAIKPRQVPLKPNLEAALLHYRSTLPSGPGLLFPTLWSGSRDPKDLKLTTGRLSQHFIALYKSAGVENITEHDLRHEATCRWIELRSPRGGWLYNEVEIAKMLGWESLDLFLRYASIRGEDLAARMYA